MRKIRVALAPWLMLVAFACAGDGAGCASCGPLSLAPYPASPAPGSEVQPSVLSARLTRTGLDFFKDHLDILIAALFVEEGDRWVFYFDESQLSAGGAVSVRDGCIGTNGGFCSQPTWPSKISFERDTLTNNLVFSWLDADAQGRPGLRFALTDFDLFMDVGLVTNIPGLGPAACHVRDQGALAAVHMGAISFDVRLFVDTSGPTPRLGGVTENVTIDLGDTTEESAVNLSVSACDLDLDPSCQDPLCTADQQQCEDVCYLLDLFSQLGGFLTAVLNPLLDTLAPLLADAVSEQMIRTLGAVPLFVEGRYAPTETMDDAFFGHIEDLGFKVTPNPALTVSGQNPGRGLSVGVDVGIGAQPAGACAGAAPPDLAALRGPAPEYSGFVEVQDAQGQSHVEAYHLALSVSEALLTQAAWAAYETGFLCVAMDAYDFASFTSSFVFTAQLLQTFDQNLAPVARPESPLYAVLRATKAPLVSIGSGNEIAPGIDDPHLALTVDDFEIDLYMHVDEAWHRVSGLTADVTVSLDVERTPDNAIELVLHGIEVFDVRQRYNEIAPAANVAGIIEVIAGVALDTFFAFLGEVRGTGTEDGALRFSFDLASSLSAALGMPLELRINAIRRDYGPTGVAHLSAYATVCDEDDLDDPQNLACYLPPGSGTRSATFALGRAEPVYASPEATTHDLERWYGVPSGAALLTVEGEDLELQTRVDEGPWSSFRRPQGGKLVVESPRLYLLGPHVIRVRARIVEAPSTLSEVESVAITVDPEAPEIVLTRRGDIVGIEVADLGSPEAVEVTARIVDSDAEHTFLPVGAEIDVGGRVGRLEVLARDAAGNTTLASLALASLEDPPSAGGPAAPPAEGCAAAPSWLAALAALAFTRRRRQR